MLYLISTPIGNLQDFTPRAIETLKLVDYILCEDTRHSSTLFHHFQISKPLKSYHKFNEASQIENILNDLKQGKKIGLTSDAGTPCISDPGFLLVKECQIHRIPVSSIPGPCALIAALSCSGLDTNRFQFIGFFPKKEGELKQVLIDALLYPGTTVGYESPRRLVETLKMIQSIDPKALLSVARELTKIHEEVKTCPVGEHLDYWGSMSEIKGEVVLMLSGHSHHTTKEWLVLTPLQHVDYLEKTFHLSKKEAIKLTAELRGVPKSSVYNSFFE